MTNIDSCRVSNVGDWVSCLHVSMEQDIVGFCIPMDTVDQMDISTSGTGHSMTDLGFLNRVFLFLCEHNAHTCMHISAILILLS